MRELVSDRANRLEGSSTILVNQKADELRRKGFDVISLALGEPDFNTPDFVKEACKKAIDDNFTRYTPSSGIPELREAIAEKSRRDNKIACQARDVIVSPTKLGLYAAVSSLVNPGEEVLLTDPCFVSYAPQVRFNNGTPVYVPLSEDNGYSIRADDVAEKITKKTKLIMLCSPSNPTGGIDDPKELKGVVDLANDHDFAIISDEIYEKLVYDGAKHVSPASLPGGWERTITINGLSKSFAMTGWRIGWVLAPDPFNAAISKIQTQSITHITSFVQKAAVTALQGPQDSVIAMRDEFKRRRDLLLNEIKTLPGWSSPTPKGAFYLWPKFTQNMTSQELCTYLLEEAHVALVPGSSFGPNSDRNIRISYAQSVERLTEAMQRIRAALKKLETSRPLLASAKK